MSVKNSAFINDPDDEILDLAVVFITTEGIQHSSGGVAKYIRNFIYTIAQNVENIRKYAHVNITIYAAEPALLPFLPTYHKNKFAECREVIEATGGKFYKLVNNTMGEDWISHVENWKVLSSSAATIALNISENHRSTLVLFGSSCLALTQVYIHKQLKAFNGDVRTVYITHDSAFSTFHKEKNEDILAMDYLCAQWTEFSRNAKVGYVSAFMKKLFMDKYYVQEQNMVPCAGGVDTSEERFRDVDEGEVLRILSDFDIPLDKKIYFSWGRSEEYKRFDLLFQSKKYLDDSFFPIVVTNGRLNGLSQYIKHNNIQGRLIENYSGFSLISALCKWKNTFALCFFSENEPGAISPMEAMYLSHNTRAVMLTNFDGIYSELIVDGENGFKIKNVAAEIADCLIRIAEMSNDEARKFNDRAYYTIVDSYEQKYKFFDTLACCVPRIEKYRNDIIRCIYFNADSVKISKTIDSP